MIATSGFLTPLECTKFVFSWGSLQCSPRPSSGFKGGLTSKERREEEKGRKGIGERREREKEGKGREGKG